VNFSKTRPGNTELLKKSWATLPLRRFSAPMSYRIWSKFPDHPAELPGASGRCKSFCPSSSYPSWIAFQRHPAFRAVTTHLHGGRTDVSGLGKDRTGFHGVRVSHRPVWVLSARTGTCTFDDHHEEWSVAPDGHRPDHGGGINQYLCCSATPPLYSRTGQGPFSKRVHYDIHICDDPFLVFMGVAAAIYLAA
jgi:hypothetical protein